MRREKRSGNDPTKPSIGASRSVIYLQRKILLFLLSVLSLSILTGELFSGPPEEILRRHAKELSGSTQLLLVTIENGRPLLRGYARKEDDWVAKLGPFPLSIGYAGFAASGAKKEGDGKTPTGIYRLGTAFGYDATIRSKMPYRQATAQDFWVDDVDSPDYNTWVHGHTSARSFERMLRTDSLYSLGLVIEYNTNPVLRGRGSAIFLHVAPKPTSVTAGCLAVSRRDIEAILAWLDPAAEPKIAILPMEQ